MEKNIFTKEAINMAKEAEALTPAIKGMIQLTVLIIEESLKSMDVNPKETKEIIKKSSELTSECLKKLIFISNNKIEKDLLIDIRKKMEEIPQLL